MGKPGIEIGAPGIGTKNFVAVKHSRRDGGRDRNALVLDDELLELERNRGRLPYQRQLRSDGLNLVRPSCTGRRAANRSQSSRWRPTGHYPQARQRRLPDR
jgi:hypothetical protein